jgi:hypothetical protein
LRMNGSSSITNTVARMMPPAPRFRNLDRAYNLGFPA